MPNRISLRLDEESVKSLDHNAGLVLRHLKKKGYNVTDAIKFALVFYGKESGLIPRGATLDEYWETDTEERMAKRIVAMLQELNVNFSDTSQNNEVLNINEFSAFD